MSLLVPFTSYYIIFLIWSPIKFLFLETFVLDSSLSDASLSSFHDSISSWLNLGHPASRLDKHLASSVIMALANSSMLTTLQMQLAFVYLLLWISTGDSDMLPGENASFPKLSLPGIIVPHSDSRDYTSSKNKTKKNTYSFKALPQHLILVIFTFCVLLQHSMLVQHLPHMQSDYNGYALPTCFFNLKIQLQQ